MNEKELIVKALKDVFAKNKITMKDEEIEKLIETPPSADMGDFAFPCFVLAKFMKKSPKDIALKIREGIDLTGFEDIQTNGGYLNFFINRNKFAWELVKQILEEKENFGSIDIGKGEKALVEHTSINPNASPHVGRARNAIIGDSIVRIMNFFNFKTEVHYYVNDVSKQIAMLVLAGAEKLKFESMLKKYVGISGMVAKSKQLEKKVFDLLYKFEQGDKSVVKNFKKVTETCVKGQEKILADMGIHYDFFDYESAYLEKTKEILAMLEKTGRLFKDEAGRLVLNQEGTSVEGKMKAPVLVLTRNDGTGLYPLRDIAYTIDKMQISNNNVIVLGEDQKLYFQQVSEALKLLGFSSPEVIHYSFILLNSKGKSKKMSTRKGEVVLLEDFIEEAISKAKREIHKRGTKGDAKKIGISAVKYAIIKNSTNKIISFNLDEALNFEGDTGPYILYTYARASSILKKAEKNEQDNLQIKKLEDKEIELVKKLSAFPNVTLTAYNTFNPSVIANYSYQLAQIFNEFYHSCPVIDSNNESFRLSLVEAFRYVLKNSLNLLGIETIEKM